MITAAHHTMFKHLSVEFSGDVNSYLTYGSSQNTLSNFTVSMWCKALHETTSGLMFKYGSGCGWGMGFGSQRANISYIGQNFVYLYEGYTWKNTSGFSQDKTIWHHYAMSRNGSSFSYYLDGSSYISDTQSSFATGVGSFYIGGQPSTEQRCLPCRITRVSFWNRSLSAFEVSTDFTDGRNSPSITNGLEHFWPLSSTDNYLKDLVGNAPLIVGANGVSLSFDTLNI